MSTDDIQQVLVVGAGAIGRQIAASCAEHGLDVTLFDVNPVALESAEAHLDRVCDDWSNGVDHGGEWPLKIVAAKHAVVSQAWSVVDTALDVSGGAGILKRNRLERLVRDARLGRVHPGNPMLTHELVGKLSLGINPDEQPRWG